ncbi:MAG: HAMP domain-containing sensor histidine kinase [bacterium]
MDKIIILLDIVTFFATLAFGVFVIGKNHTRESFRAFFLTMLGMSGWAFCIASLIAGLGPTELLARGSFSFGILGMTAFSWFAVVFPSGARHERFWKIIIFILGTICFFIPFYPGWVSNVAVRDSAITSDFHPVLFPLLSLYDILILISSFIILAVRYVATRGVDRERLKQVFIGFTLFFVASITTNLVLPGVLNDSRWNNIGPAFALLLAPFMANAILKYRLLDIRWIVSKSIVLSALIGLVVWILMTVSYFLASIFSQQSAFLLGTLIVALTILPLSRAIEKWVSHIFERGSYNSSELMNKVFAIVRNEIDVNEIATSILKNLKAAFGAEAGAFIVFAPKSTHQIATVIQSFGPEMRNSIPQIALLLKRHPNQIIETAELEWNLTYGDEALRHPEDRKMLKGMKEARIDLIIPLVMKDALVGIIVLGERRFDRVLHQAEFDFVNLLRAGIAPGVENAAKFAEIQELNTKLRESDAIKSRFIDTISHQFRTPLSSIRWNIETLLDPSSRMNKEEQGMLGEIQTNSTFLIRTLTLFTDVIQFESNSVGLEQTKLETSEIESALSEYAALAKAKKIAFTATIEPAAIVGDKKYLLRALDEILRNALEYTSAEGQVKLRVVPVDGMVKLEVSDSGIGMSSVDAQKRAFTKFYRGKNAILEHPDGIGLGLYLVKLVIEKLGGSVSLESEIGKGTVVSMLLPRLKSEGPEVAVDNISKKKNRKAV